jgi:hypothetical protein
MSNPFTVLKNEAKALYEKLDGHKEVTDLLHRALAAIEAFVEKEAPVVGAAVGGAIGGPTGAVVGAAVATVVKEEAPKLEAAVEQKADSEVPK